MNPHPRMIREANDIAREINARNERVTRRADAAAKFLTALAIGMALGGALAHWATCGAGC